jgi:signal transduction histidine kinase
MGTFEDVTDVREMEEQIRHAQRMESVGNLAGSLAHDFNNLLTVINGYSDLLLARLPEDSSARSAVNEIRKAGAKAADLTGKLLAFSRKEMMHPAPVDINEALLAMEGLLLPILGPRIKLHYDLQPGLPQVFLDQPHLEQSILNLATNSRDAMSGGGDFTIQTRLAASPGESARSWIEIRVTDTGDGIDPATQKRIFDPFFTTKPKGKGTGLGLAGVYGFVRRSGGIVDVHSAPGAGTTMILRLPPIAQPSDIVASEASSA